MVSNLGFKLNSFAPISGFGMHRRRRVGYGEGLHKWRVVHVGIGEGMHHRRRLTTRSTSGRGLPRKIVGTVIKHVGHALIDRLSSAISGSGSFKLVGMGRKPRARKPRARKPRRVLTTFGGYRPRTHRRRIRVMI